MVHLRVHIGGKKFKCELCGILLGAKQTVQRHMKNVHELKDPDDVRFKRLAPEYVPQYIDGELIENSFACEFCSEKFRTRKLLNAHREKHELPCTVCGKVFRGPARLKRHSDDHGRVMTCTICAMNFSRKHGLESHMKLVHGNDPPQTCVQCGATLYKHNFKIHMAKHAGTKLYRCELESCGKEFLHASSYFRHKVSHTGERRYECNVCGKKSLQQGHHVRHMMLHGEPTQLCEICNKKFHFIQGLKKHMRRKHSSEQPFLCEQCGESFVSEPKRTEHMKVAHNVTLPMPEATERASNASDSQISVCATGEKTMFETVTVEMHDGSDDGIGGDDHHFDDDFGNDYEDLSTSHNPAADVTHDSSDFHYDTQTQVTVDYDQPYAHGANLEEANHDNDTKHAIEPEQFFCTVCCKKFDDNSAYQSHLEIHTERVESCCSECNAVFYDTNSYNLHMWSHKNEVPTPCTFCAKPLYKDTFDRHMITHSGKNPFHCKVCGHKCLNAIMYDRHMASKHGENRTLQCTLCPQSFSRKTHFTRHMKVHTAKRMLTCEVCKRTFYDFKGLKGHMARIHSLDKAYGCEHCDERFDVEADRDGHVKECSVRARVKSEEQNGFGCAHCDARFTDRNEIVKHMEMHAKGDKAAEQEEEEAGPLYCEKCGKKFKKKAQYERHIRIHSKNKPFVCEICGNGFLDKKTYRKHVTRHDKSRLHQCTLCSRQFTHRYDLRIHTMIHEGKIPFQCTECQQTFKYRNSLARHMRVHAGIKDYKCQICAKEFYQSGHLNEHMKMHEDGPGHTCTICDRTFKYMLSFKRHMRKVHSSVKPFLCEKCGDRFADEKQRDEHAAKHENEDDDEPNGDSGDS